jgi:cbb3-type cytochrome oxidase subunit 3
VTRVWPLDYRQLPWAPIAVFVLFTVAGLLYVYEPDARTRRRTAQDEESTFEEIGG